MYSLGWKTSPITKIFSSLNVLDGRINQQGRPARNTSQESMPLTWLHFAAPASGMHSGLAGGSAPWTPGGYIPVANMLFIPVSSILFIPVSNILFIPVSNILFIPVPNMLWIPVSNMLFIPVPNMLFTPALNPLFIPVSKSLLSQSALYFYSLSQSATHPFTFQHLYII